VWHLCNLVFNALKTMTLSTMVSLTNTNTCHTGALSNQTCLFLDFCFETSLNLIHSVTPIELSILALQYDSLGTLAEVTVAVCGFSLYAIRRNYLRDKCLLEDTATSPTVGLFGMEIHQYVVMYTVHTVESSVLKGPPYLHRRVMKPSTTVSSCVKAKVSKCWVTSDRGFEICILKSHGWSQ